MEAISARSAKQGLPRGALAAAPHRKGERPGLLVAFAGPPAALANRCSAAPGGPQLPMMALEPTPLPPSPSDPDRPHGTGDAASERPARVGALRGAGVSADTGVVIRVAVALAMATVAVVSVVLLVAGYQKNAQITSLRTHGVPVEATVSGCIGLLGGSGSNAAGYACTGSYVLDGHHHSVAIPGTSQLAPGSTVAGVSVPSDPALFTTRSVLAGERVSAHVYLAPAVLLVVLAAVTVLLVAHRRRVRRRG